MLSLSKYHKFNQSRCRKFRKIKSRLLANLMQYITLTVFPFGLETIGIARVSMLGQYCGRTLIGS